MNPDPVPSPGMAGGPKANTTASLIRVAKLKFSLLIRLLAWSLMSGRSSQSRNCRKMKPAFGCVVPVSRLNPLIVV